MKDWLGFVLGNKRVLNFGFLFNFFSSFGQTFFVSLFVPFWVESIEISNAAFGSVYASVTIVSAVLLSVTGGYIDRMSLKSYGFLVFAGLMMAVMVLASAHSVVWLTVGLLLVRWFGQGLMTHTSSTGIAKYFDAHRGKALGVTALGHPAGQFILPLVVMPLIAVVGWRWGLLYTALAASAILVPALFLLKADAETVPDARTQRMGASKRASHLFSAKFWIIALNVFTIPFITTAVFLYQYILGQSKGWDAQWVAFSFAAYALFNALALLVSGPLVDKYSGRTLFPLYLIPAVVGLALMFFTDTRWAGPLFYALMGLSGGLGSTIKTALQVEVYGTENLGTIRSHFSTLLVVSTALGPPAFGFFIDRNYSFNAVMCISALFVALTTLISFRIWKV